MCFPFIIWNHLYIHVGLLPKNICDTVFFSLILQLMKGAIPWTSRDGIYDISLGHQTVNVCYVYSQSFW